MPKKRLRLYCGWTKVRYPSLRLASQTLIGIILELDFDKANEILFRLGIIYKQQSKYEESLACFDKILKNPPSPLAHADIWFQIGHVYEQQKDVSLVFFSESRFQTHAYQPFSMSKPRTRTNVLWRITLCMQRYFNNSGGYIIKMVPPSRTKILLFNTSQRVSNVVCVHFLQFSSETPR